MKINHPLIRARYSHSFVCRVDSEPKADEARELRGSVQGSVSLVSALVSEVSPEPTLVGDSNEHNYKVSKLYSRKSLWIERYTLD